MIFYTTRFVKKPHAATTYGPVIFIDPAYKDDVGLREHERTHVKQWWASLGLSSILYLVSKQYRLWAEVQAYKVQLRFSPGNEDRFAGFIADRYDLDITQAEAVELLR